MGVGRRMERDACCGVGSDAALQEQELIESRSVVDKADDVFSAFIDLEGQLVALCRREVGRVVAIGIRCGCVERGLGDDIVLGIEDASLVLGRSLPCCHGEGELVVARLEVQRISRLASILSIGDTPVERFALIATETSEGAWSAGVGVGILMDIGTVDGSPSFRHGSIVNVGEVEHIVRRIVEEDGLDDNVFIRHGEGHLGGICSHGNGLTHGEEYGVDEAQFLDAIAFVRSDGEMHFLSLCS